MTMSFKSSVKNIITNWLFPDYNNDGYTSDSVYLLQNTTRKRISYQTALANTAVWASVRVVAESIATLPCHVYKKDNGIRIKDTAHPIYKILHDSPNETTSSINFFESMLTHLLIYGNSFVEIVRDRFGDVASLHILEPQLMTVKSENGTLLYEYNFNGNLLKYNSEKILHVAGLGWNGIVGFSPLHLFSNDIRTMKSQGDFALDFFSNGAKKTPVLKYSGKLKDEAKQSLKSSFRDSWNNGIVLLEEGIEVEPMTMALSDAQFLESRRFSVEEIARIYRVPPHMIGDLSRATFSNIEHQAMSFVQNTILPWCARIEKAINIKLFNDTEKSTHFVKFALDGLLRGDTTTRNQVYKIQQEAGILSINEWRALEDLPPINEKYADDYFISQQIRPIETAYVIEETNKKGTTNEKTDDDDTTDSTAK